MILMLILGEFFTLVSDSLINAYLTILFIFT